MPSGRSLRDAALKATKPLPSGASSVTSSGVDLDTAPGEDFFAKGGEFLLTAPALAVGQLANGSTMTYSLIHSANPDMSSPATLVAGAIVQTGAGGVGAALATYRYAPPTNVRRYVGFTAVNSAAADASAASGTLEWLN